MYLKVVFYFICHIYTGSLDTNRPITGPSQDILTPPITSITMHCVNRYDMYWNGDGSVKSVKLGEGGSIAKVGKTDCFPFVFSADVCTFFTFVWTPEMSSYRHRPRPNRTERRGQNMGHCGPIIGWSDTITSEYPAHLHGECFASSRGRTASSGDSSCVSM